MWKPHMQLNPSVRTFPLRGKLNKPLFAIKLDIKNFFFHFKLSAPTARKFRFAFDGEIYQFICLPMGTRAAPAICHNFLFILLKDFLTGCGVEWEFFRVHIDDVLIVSSEEALNDIVTKLLLEFDKFDIKVNFKNFAFDSVPKN